METQSTQNIRNPFKKNVATEQRPAPKTEVEKKQENPAEAAAKELYGAMFHDIKSALESAKSPSEANIPDFTNQINIADGQTLSLVKNAVEKYQQALDAWLEKNADKATPAQREEAENNTRVTEKMTQVLANHMQTRAESAVGELFAKKPVKEKPVVTDDDEWAETKTLEHKKEIADRIEAAASEILASNWPTNKTNLGTLSERASDESMTDEEVQALRQDFKVRATSGKVEALKERPLTPEQEKALNDYARHALEVQDTQIIAAVNQPERETKAERNKVIAKSEITDFKGSFDALSPAAERAADTINDIQILIDAQAREVLPAEQEAKASDSKRVLEYFKELPAWFKKGFAKLMEASEPPNRTIVGGTTLKIERGGVADRAIRNQRAESQAEARVESIPELNAQQIATLSIELEDALGRQYPDNTAAIANAGARQTAPELSYEFIKQNIQDPAIGFAKKLDLIRELNYRYQSQDRVYGSSVVPLSRESYARAGNIIAERKAQSAKMTESVEKNLPQNDTEENQKAA